MKKLLTKSFLILIIVISSQNLYSQQKGSFKINVNIITGSRPISFYVPNDYDSTKKYSLMICLHGSGQPCNSYRDNLCPAWAGFIKNTIFACPEGGGSAGDFYNQKGDETIIDSAISYAEANYNIDDSRIILQGFSLGGRSALKYGLDNPDKFKGLLLNTPAVQSQLDAKNDPVYSLKYNYQNGTKLPIAITHGATDQGYYFIIDTVFKILTDNNAMAIFTRVAGMGHSISNNTLTQACLDFINQPLKNTPDADITKILHPGRIYEPTIKPSFRMRNRGASEITSAEITYSINGAAAKYSWSGSLLSFEHADIELPEVTCAENANKLIVTIDTINDEYANPALSVKQYTTQFQSLTQGIKLPIEFGFELTEPTLDYWSLETAGGMVSWGVYTDSHTEGNNALMMYNTPFFNINQGLSEENLSPLMDLTSVNNPCLAFDIAFSNIKLTPAGGYSQTYIFSDTLNIVMTTDGGKTYNSIYSKAGDKLLTAASPITDPPSLNDCIFIPSSNQWRTEIIKLDNYKDFTKAAFIFKDVSGMGGTLWLDNIRFMSYDDIIGVDETADISGLIISPNPAKEMINMKFPEYTNEIRIFNAAGIEIFKQDVGPDNKDLRLSSDGFNSGVYIIEAIAGNKTISEKLVIIK
ncbi:MAG: Por Secre tail protein [Bacteroidota bacterium]|nr:Por Secre tail protein [Bacteroidota bacterium]